MCKVPAPEAPYVAFAGYKYERVVFGPCRCVPPPRIRRVLI